jgi:hypothetical protein
MHIGSDEKHHLAQLLSFLLSGEHIAHRCAAEQAKLCDDKTMNHFLRKQSRQEKFHAGVFSSAIMWLTPKGSTNPARKQMQNYEQLLIRDLHSKNLLASIYGLQVILEGMADVALSRLNHGFEQRGDNYQKIRQTILMQEEAHHEFGMQFTTINGNRQDAISMSEPYLSTMHDIFIPLQPLFELFDEDSNDYLLEFYQKLPGCLVTDAVDYHPRP